MRLIPLFLFLFIFSSSFSNSAEAKIDFSKEEYLLYANIMEARQSEKYGKLAEDDLLKAVSKIIKAPLDKLKAAKEKVEPEIENAKSHYKSTVKKVLNDTTLKKRMDKYSLNGKIDEINIILDGPKPVGFIRWTNSNRKHLDQEACLAAFAFSQAGDLLNTIVLQAVDPKIPGDDGAKQVFEAKISASAITKIKKNRIAAFAKRLMRRFDGVRYGPAKKEKKAKK